MTNSLERGQITNTTETQGADAGVATAQAKRYTFKTIGQLGWYTKMLLRLAAGAALIYAAAGGYQYAFFEKFESNGFNSDLELEQSAERSDLFFSSSLMLYAGLLIISGILFLFWIYRAAANVHSVDPNAIRYTPRWAVGWNFVPIAWFWMPYLVVKSIWYASHHTNPDIASVPNTFRWWWGCWIASQLVGQAGDRVFERGVDSGNVTQMKIGTAVGVLDALLFVAAAILLAKIVDELSRVQDSLLANPATIFE